MSTIAWAWRWRRRQRRRVTCVAPVISGSAAQAVLALGSQRLWALPPLLQPAARAAHSYSAGFMTSSICEGRHRRSRRETGCVIQHGMQQAAPASTPSSPECLLCPTQMADNHSWHIALAGRGTANCLHTTLLLCAVLCYVPLHTPALRCIHHSRTLRIILQTCVASMSCCFLPISVSNTFCRNKGARHEGAARVGAGVRAENGQRGWAQG